MERPGVVPAALEVGSRGLGIVRRATELLGGTIPSESALARGTTMVA